MPTQKNSASWDLQLGFNLAFKRLNDQVYIEISAHCTCKMYYLNRKRQNYEINGSVWKIKHRSCLKNVVNFLIPVIYKMKFKGCF